VRKYLFPYIFNKDTNGFFWKSSLLLILAKCISVTSPFILKTIVNSLAVVSADGGVAAAAGTVVAAKRFTLVKSLASWH